VDPDPSQQPASTTQDLLRASAGEARDPSGSVRAQIANAMVGMKKRFYGRGPDAAKAWILDDYVFVAMEGGLTRGEETMVADGKETQVRTFRLSFEETMAPVATAAIEELTGRRVIGYHSQITFGPVRAFEIFVLEPEG
jgi:uncharacterized protein YbcI